MAVTTAARMVWIDHPRTPEPIKMMTTLSHPRSPLHIPVKKWKHTFQWPDVQHSTKLWIVVHILGYILTMCKFRRDWLPIIIIMGKFILEKFWLEKLIFFLGQETSRRDLSFGIREYFFSSRMSLCKISASITVRFLFA